MKSRKTYKNYVKDNEMSMDIPLSTLRRWNQNDNVNQNMHLDSPIEEFFNEDDNSECLFTENNYDSDTSNTTAEFNDEFETEDCFLNDDNFMETNNEKDWIKQVLYNSATVTVGEAVNLILDFFFFNNLTKEGLKNLLILLDQLLPKPHNLPRTKYKLLKLLETLTPFDKNVKKHQFCADCSQYIGLSESSASTAVCDNCGNNQNYDLFIEYNLQKLIQDAFEVRDLKNLIDEHNMEIEKTAKNYIYDFTTAREYKKLKEGPLNGKYDVCLLWNTDGAPVSQSSNGQIWPVQVKILNIPVNKRKSYQFIVGLYYSTCSKPPMNSFLKPFVESLKSLYNVGIEWFNKSTNSIECSKVFGPVATLDAPARATVQNIMQYNGAYGCTLCEHPGVCCSTGLGHTRVYPILPNEPPLRTKNSILEQANEVIRNDLNHLNGVKGVSITATIPYFDCASSFVVDYMHAILLGVVRMLISLWFDGKNKKKEFFIKNHVQKQINKEIELIVVPDFVIRLPVILKYRKYLKASQLRDFLLFYFPIILKNRLPEKYYRHFLLLAHGTRILLQEKIHLQQINIAESLLGLFAQNIESLYGLEKCTFNVHQLTHMAYCVRKWGPLWTWSAFSFEDAIGHLKKLNHGPNKVDMEIINTLNLLNVRYILKDLLKVNIDNENECSMQSVLGKPVKHNLNIHELEVLQMFNITESIVINNSITQVFTRAVIGKEIFTSSLYKRQNKRQNSIVTWNCKTQFGIIQFFIQANNSAFAIVREYVRNYNEKYTIHNQIKLDLHDILIPVRLTYSYYIVPLNQITGKVLFVDHYVCLMPNAHERR